MEYQFEITESDFVRLIGRRPENEGEFLRFCELLKKRLPTVPWEIISGTAGETMGTLW